MTRLRRPLQGAYDGPAQAATSPCRWAARQSRRWRYNRARGSREAQAPRETDRARCHCFSYPLGFDFGDQSCFRSALQSLGRLIHVIARDLIEILGEHQSRRPVLGKPPIARVAHNGQRPGARVAAAKSANALEGSERSLLHDVLGIDAAPGQPPGEPKSIDEVREEHLGKAILICRVAHIQPVEAASL